MEEVYAHPIIAHSHFFSERKTFLNILSFQSSIVREFMNTAIYNTTDFFHLVAALKMAALPRERNIQGVPRVGVFRLVKCDN